MSDASMVELPEDNGAGGPVVRENGKGGSVSINTDQLIQDKAKAAAEAAAATAEKNDKGQDGQEKPQSVKPMPSGGQEKFYNAKTGEYNYEAHVREENWRKEQAARKAAKGNPPEQKPEQGGDEAAKELAESAGLDWDDLGDKINVLGDIDEEDYASLEKIGVPRAIAADYVRVHKVAAEAVQKEALAYVGGEKARDELIAWAAQNISEGEIARYNDMLASPDWRIAVDAIRARRAASGRGAHEPQNRVNGINQAGDSADVYRSFEEQMVDQRDPRYKTDPAFRQKVSEKAARSNYSLRSRI